MFARMNSEGSEIDAIDERQITLTDDELAIGDSQCADAAGEETEAKLENVDSFEDEPSADDDIHED